MTQEDPLSPISHVITCKLWAIDWHPSMLQQRRPGNKAGWQNSFSAPMKVEDSKEISHSEMGRRVSTHRHFPTETCLAEIFPHLPQVSPLKESVPRGRTGIAPWLRSHTSCGAAQPVTYQVGRKWVQILTVSLVIWKELRMQSKAELFGWR